MLKRQILQPVVAMRHFKKRSVIKNYQFLAIIVTVLFFCSCQKGALKDTATTANTSAEADLKNRNRAPLNYGAAIGSPDTTSNDFNFQIGVADQLGVSCLRERVLVPNNNLNTVLVPELYTKYKVLLHFTSPGEGKKTVPFRTDLAKYKQDLNDILNNFTVMPVVALIENEESNRFYYSGTTQEYINQLNAGIEVMHARNIKVGNGAITSLGLNLLVYYDLLNQGKNDSAQMFMNLAQVAPDSPATQNRAAFIDTLLTNYRNMNLDFVNFHWKDSFASTQVLNQAINYLQKRTRKKIITTEIGQLLPDTNILLTHVQLCTDQSLRYIIWYSPDINSGLRGYPLQYPDGTLTPNGYTYKGYLSQ